MKEWTGKTLNMLSQISKKDSRSPPPPPPVLSKMAPLWLLSLYVRKEKLRKKEATFLFPQVGNDLLSSHGYCFESNPMQLATSSEWLGEARMGLSECYDDVIFTEVVVVATSLS